MQGDWRLLPLLQAPGAVQMALDRWLMEQLSLGLQPPTLRFYTWSPPAISLGYHQRRYPAHWQTLCWQGQPVELVRRPTGGRAVLHQGELTYAITVAGLPGSRMQVYQSLCEFLIEGWRSLGVDLYYGQAGRGYIHNPNCFGTATIADLILPDGRKLIGSAQFRRGSVVLQHGSMRLCPDPDLYRLVFGEEMALSDPAGQVAVADGVSPEAIAAQLIPALISAAERIFHIRLVMQPLTLKEWDGVMAIARSQFSKERE